MKTETDKKIHENESALIEMNKQLMKLEKVIQNMTEKRGNIFIEWLENQNKYLEWEENFDPSYLRAYKRSEIIFANFGFNVGAEYGGMHYGVVIKDSSKHNPNVNVVPLTSLEEGETEENLHRDRLFIGQITGLNKKNSVAIPDQMRPISKIRIVKPKKAYHQIFKLTNDQMDLLDERIRRMYTKLRPEEK
ncbi:type II toxin-antitoxin system PemK/MazF family toxin [Bacillus suaedae]|uniref:Type II toxin-antitoxin system PemK/MazF family toxin n=1 Tax=Halalkalibacter suaedae TaxID=2822140 RepID=A0A940WZ70_9BACI|nr:type II toxin-antitoxin system PemK/MazF family toxin [Bacillus suaedae]MBP3953628.1 type II toxin-antitoxin system PemK/MazF family toxin [Bacillus suaedae]